MGLLKRFAWFSRPNASAIRPYATAAHDGVVQMSFTLPIPVEEKAREAARLLVEKMGFESVEVTSMEAISKEFSTFVVYGKTKACINYDSVVVSRIDIPERSPEKINHLIHEKMKRPLVILGATLGQDAYAVAMDALISTGGLGGEFGLESYSAFKTYHLRGHVSAEELLKTAKEVSADVLIVAPPVEDNPQQLALFSGWMAVLRADTEFYKSVLPLCVDTHLTAKQLHSLGFRAGFPPRTLPSRVANFIVHEWVK